MESGVAYTILSYSCVHHLISAARIRCWPIVQPTMTRSLVIATSTQRPMTKAVKALTRIVSGQVHALVADGRWMPKR